MPGAVAAGFDIAITGVEVHDVRFPTSRTLAGSDAMNEAPDYSAAYVILATDSPLTGHGMTFTIGRGTEIVVAAIHALAPRVVGLRLDEVAADPGRFWRAVTGDSQLRWIGPEKGAIHLEPAALVSCVDFRYITDALTPAEAVTLLEQRFDGRAERLERVRADGLPAYTTSVGWV